MNLDRRVRIALLRNNPSAMLPFLPAPDPPPENQKGKALLVIDIDYTDGWRESTTLPKKRQKVAASLKKRLANIRLAGIPVIFVMFDNFHAAKTYAEPQLKMGGSCIGCDRKENRLARFLNHVHFPRFEPVLVKYHGDAFKNPGLAPYLRSIGIKEVILAGCDTFSCVKATAEGAVRNGFHVALFEDCTDPPFTSERSNTKEAWIRDVQQCVQPNAQSAVSVRATI